MGCGTSTFNRDHTGGAGGPTYLYVNPLHFDFPWRRKGDRAAVESDPSEKLLDEDDGESMVRKSVSMAPLLPKDNGFKKEPLVQTMKEIPRTKDDSEERSIGDDLEQDNRRSNSGNNHGDSDEASDREDSIFYPGSPSFRDYCTSRCDDDDDDSDDTSAPINEGKSDSALMMEDNHKSCKDQNSGETDPPKLSRSQLSSSSSRKSRRSAKQRLRAVLPKRNRMSGMKNLLHGS